MLFCFCVWMLCVCFLFCFLFFFFLLATGSACSRYCCLFSRLTEGDCSARGSLLGAGLSVLSHQSGGDVLSFTISQPALMSSNMRWCCDGWHLLSSKWLSYALHLIRITACFDERKPFTTNLQMPLPAANFFFFFFYLPTLLLSHIGHIFILFFQVSFLQLVHFIN